MEVSKNNALQTGSLVRQKISSFIDWFEVISLSVGVFLLATILIANVIARNFFRSIYFAEELSEFFVIFITFVGVSYAVRKARHIRMGAIFDAMPPKMQKVFIYIISGISATVMFLMAYYSYNYMMVAKAMGHDTPSLRLPYWFFLAIIPVGFFSAGVQYIRTIIKNIVEEEVWLSPEQQSEYEDEIIPMSEEEIADVVLGSGETDTINIRE
ncbi:MAG: TRAP transporter small permease [Bacillota bacterium]|nr:TRAP transporter small permease [Bacillota bacterium]MDW7683147.1 TRAP transporter small permease [Bacillota bacterium]